MAFDLVDGGIPATFVDGPKQGHVGVVTPEGDTPPQVLRFLDGGSLVYVRHKRQKVRAIDGMTGEQVTYAGVAYRMDKECPFALDAAQADREARAQARAGRVETL